MARTYLRATRTVVALMLSPAGVLKLSIMGIGLAVFAGQYLPRLRDGIRRDGADGTPDDDAGLNAANGTSDSETGR